MSRSTQREVKENPCVKFLKWKNNWETKEIEGEEIKVLKGGGFYYWDKELEKDIAVELPLIFAVLETDTFSYRGFSKTLDSFLYSNEVRNRYGSLTDSNMELKVMVSKDKSLLNTISVKNIKNEKGFFDSHGLTKIQSIYIAVKNKKKWEIWNLQLQKSQLSGGVDPKKKSEEDKLAGWWNFAKVVRNKLFSHYIEINKFDVKKTDMTKYTVPKFELGEQIEEEFNDVLVQLDKELQEYLEWYYYKPQEIKAEENNVIDNLPPFDAEETYPTEWDDL